MILDNLGVHNSHKVRDSQEKHMEYIDLFFLLAYSTERNLREYLSCDLKSLIRGGKHAKNRGELERKIGGAMMQI